MTVKELNENVLIPRFDAIDKSINGLIEPNKKEHEKLSKIIDVIQNGNGIMGHRELVSEWTKFKNGKSAVATRAFQIFLVFVNVVVGACVGALMLGIV